MKFLLVLPLLFSFVYGSNLQSDDGRDGVVETGINIVSAECKSLEEKMMKLKTIPEPHSDIEKKEIKKTENLIRRCKVRLKLLGNMLGTGG